MGNWCGLIGCSCAVLVSELLFGSVLQDNTATLPLVALALYAATLAVRLTIWAARSVAK